jgi:hypothetical protein
MKQLISWCLLFTMFGCKDNTGSRSDSTINSGDSIQIYPVSSFFIEQIRKIDSLQLPTVKYTSQGERRDTTAASMEEVKMLAQEFIDADISKASLSNQYKESNFADQSIPSITFSYTATNSTLPIQRMDVILDPNPVLDEQVKTVYIEKQQVTNDTLINKKLYWKSDKNFQVITSKRITGKPEWMTQVKVSWDNSDAF